MKQKPILFWLFLLQQTKNAYRSWWTDVDDVDRSRYIWNTQTLLRTSKKGSKKGRSIHWSCRNVSEFLNPKAFYHSLPGPFNTRMKAILEAHFPLRWCQQFLVKIAQLIASFGYKIRHPSELRTPFVFFCVLDRRPWSRSRSLQLRQRVSRRWWVSSDHRHKTKSQVDEKTRKALPICLGRKSFEWMKLPSLFSNDFCQLQEDPWALTIYFKFRHIASILTEHRGFNWMGNSAFFQKPPSVTVRKSLKLHAPSSATRWPVEFFKMIWSRLVGWNPFASQVLHIFKKKLRSSIWKHHNLRPLGTWRSSST